MNINDCWQKANRLHQEGRVDEAVLLCEQESCATNYKGKASTVIQSQRRFQ